MANLMLVSSVVSEDLKHPRHKIVCFIVQISDSKSMGCLHWWVLYRFLVGDESHLKLKLLYALFQIICFSLKC